MVRKLRKISLSKPLQLATISLPDSYVRCVDLLVDLELYNSRSEIVRYAIRDFLDNELDLNKKMKETNFKNEIMVLI